jgi:4-hydroxybenzoate polyprenyltransferase
MAHAPLNLELLKVRLTPRASHVATVEWQMAIANRQPASVLFSYLRLFRLPNVFTAVADVMTGYLVVRGSLHPAAAFWCLVGASALLYTAGMVLNDVHDVQVDGRDRPDRPLPAGEIPIGWATWLGYELLLVGVALGWLAGFASFGSIALPWRSGLVVTSLAVAVVAYDRGLKDTAIGPLIMGACRALNVLLGMSLAPLVAANGPALLCGFTTPQVVLAAGMGVYVAGITWYARTEATESSQMHLTAATAVMVLGIALFGLFPYVGEIAHVKLMKPGWWALLLALLAINVVRRSLTAAWKASPSAVQKAVGHALISIIILDAAATLMVRGPYWAMLVVALLVPTFVLRRWIYLT